MPWLTNPSAIKRLYIGRTLREGPRLLEELSRFFLQAGYTVYMPYDDEVQHSPREIKERDMQALRSSDMVVLELNEASLGVAQELGAARALGKPVILITSSDKVALHNWIRGDPQIDCCRSKEDALELLKQIV